MKHVAWFLLGIGLAGLSRADMLFWLDSPTGRNNPHDPKALSAASNAPSNLGPVPTPTNTPVPCDTTGVLATFGRPASGQVILRQDIAYANSGEVFVVDSVLDKVVRLDANGAFISEWGHYGTGPGEFDSPQSLDVYNNELYVGDTYNSRIQRFDFNGNYLGSLTTAFSEGGLSVGASGKVYSFTTTSYAQTFLPGATTGSYWGTYGSGPGQFNNLADVLADEAAGYLYFLDPARIQKFTINGAYLSQVTLPTWAGSLTSDSSGNLFASTAAGIRKYDTSFAYVGIVNTLPFVSKIDVGANDEFVCTVGSRGFARLNSAGVLMSSISDTPNTLPGELYRPTGIAYANNSVYVLENGNNRICRFDLNGNFMTTWAGGSTFTFADNLVADAAGNLYVADAGNHKIQKFDGTGTHLTDIGAYGSGIGQITSPKGVLVKANGEIWVADVSLHKIARYSAAGTYLSEFGSYGNAGNGQFSWPEAMVELSNGDVLIADTSSRYIQRFDASGTFISNWASNIKAEGLATTASGQVVVVDTGYGIIKYYSQAGTLQRSRGCSGGIAGKYNVPRSVTLDPNGNLYVADSENHRIVKLGP